MKDGTLLEVGICHILRYRESSLGALLRPIHSVFSKHILVQRHCGRRGSLRVHLRLLNVCEFALEAYNHALRPFDVPSNFRHAATALFDVLRRSAPAVLQ